MRVLQTYGLEPRLPVRAADPTDSTETPDSLIKVEPTDLTDQYTSIYYIVAQHGALMASCSTHCYNCSIAREYYLTLSLLHLP
jgi:hypothetical protein